MQTDLPGTNITSPVDGTVVSYRLALAEGTYAIQVIRLAGSPALLPINGSARSIASSTGTPISSTGVSPPVATNVAIKRGDLVGVRSFDPESVIGFGGIGTTGNGVTNIVGWQPALEDGSPERFPDTGGNAELGMQATVRYCKVPKLKGKTPKAARKALNAADCTVGKLKKTNKVHDKKEVLSQSVKPGKAVSDTKPIKLGLSR